MAGSFCGKRLMHLLAAAAVAVILLVMYSPYTQQIDSMYRMRPNNVSPKPSSRVKDKVESNVGIFMYIQYRNLSDVSLAVGTICDGLISLCGSTSPIYNITFYLMYYQSESNKPLTSSDTGKIRRGLDKNLIRFCPDKTLRPVFKFEFRMISRSAALDSLTIDEVIQDGLKNGMEYICVKSLKTPFPYTRLAEGIQKIQQAPKNNGVVFLETFDNFCVHRSHMNIFSSLYPAARITNANMGKASYSLKYAYPNEFVFYVGQKKFTRQKIDSKLTELWAQQRQTFERYISKHSNETPSTENKTVLIKKMVISMSLYGNNPRYTYNALRNLKFARDNFPGWVLRFYVEKHDNSSKKKYPAVPFDITKQLETGGAELVYVNLSTVHLPPMMWRFLVADDLDVDIFIVRDCDSHLIKRDAVVVSEWLKTNASFHCIRDHPSHGHYSLSGGLWGARREGLSQTLGNRTLTSLMQGYGTQYLQDMNFLGKLWPKVKHIAYCHDSVTCEKWANSHPFPVARKGQQHIGAVYDGQGKGRSGDMSILKKTPVNKKCVPA